MHTLAAFCFGCDMRRRAHVRPSSVCLKRPERHKRESKGDSQRVTPPRGR